MRALQTSTDADTDRSLLLAVGEFNGVGGEVDQNLKESAGIEFHPVNGKIEIGLFHTELHGNVIGVQFSFEHFQSSLDHGDWLYSDRCDDEQCRVELRQGENIVHNAFLF